MAIADYTLALREERQNLWKQWESKLDESRGRERSAEETQTILRMEARLDELDAEITKIDGRLHREAESALLREADAAALGRGGERKVESRQQTENERLRAWIKGDSSYRAANPIEVNIDAAQHERHLLRSGYGAAEARAIAWDTGSIASGVPTTMARSLYENLEAFTVMMRAPTYKFTTASGEDMSFPKTNAHAIATQVSGQGTALAGTDPTFLKNTMGAFKYGELVLVSSEALTDTAFPLADFVGRDIGRALGRIIDQVLTVGTGSGQPLGIMAAVTGAGTIATGGSLITPTYEKLVDLQYSVADAYRASPSCGWLMRDSTAGTLRKLRDGGAGTVGAVLWQPSLTGGIQGGQPGLLLDYPVYTGANVAAQGSNAVIIGFGDFSAYYIRQVGSIMLDSDTSRYFDTDQVGFRGKWRIDGDLIDTAAFNIMKQSV